MLESTAASTSSSIPRLSAGLKTSGCPVRLLRTAASWSGKTLASFSPRFPITIGTWLCGATSVETWSSRYRPISDSVTAWSPLPSARPQRPSTRWKLKAPRPPPHCSPSRLCSLGWQLKILISLANCWARFWLVSCAPPMPLPASLPARQASVTTTTRHLFSRLNVETTSLRKKIGYAPET